jgi:hypothetical protein
MPVLTGEIVALGVFLGSVATVNHPYQESAGPAAGIWHLIPRDSDEQNIPDYRMDPRHFVPQLLTETPKKTSRMRLRLSTDVRCDSKCVQELASRRLRCRGFR